MEMMMPCYDCAYFNCQTDAGDYYKKVKDTPELKKMQKDTGLSDYWASYALRPGECIRYPQWLDVRGDHWCGEFVRTNASISGRHEDLYTMARLHESHESEQSSRKRAIDAEKALKEARREIRGMKAKAKPV